jgi:hypothetical protein
MVKAVKFLDRDILISAVIFEFRLRQVNGLIAGNGFSLVDHYFLGSCVVFMGRPLRDHLRKIYVIVTWVVEILEGCFIDESEKYGAVIGTE